MKRALVALALVLVACGGEEATEEAAEQQAPPEPAQPTGDPFFDRTGVEVELPEGLEEGPPGRQIEISIRADGTIFVGDEQLSREELSARARQLAAEGPRGGATIAADRTVPHGDVVAVIDLLREAGVTRYSLVVAPASEPAAAP